MMSVSDKIRVLAVRLHISLAEIARRTGQSSSNFNQKLQRNNWSINELTEIAEKCGCKFEVNFILEDGDKI